MATMKSIKLMESETHDGYLKERPFLMGSYYKRDDGFQNMEATKEALQNKIVEIIKANPWLDGRLINKNEDGKNNIYMVFGKVENPHRCIEFITNEEIFKKRDWKSTGEILTPYNLKSNFEIIDKDEPYAKFIIISNAEDTELLLIFCLSHIIGDGCTWYEIWKMMDTNEKVNSLIVEREYNVSELVNKFSNYAFVERRTATCVWTDKMSKFFRGLYRTCLFKSYPYVNIFKVKKEAIERVRTDYKRRNIHVSSNDILLSVFCGAKACTTSNLWVPVNFRGRIPEVPRKMAGNYHCFAILYSEDFKSPLTVREKMLSLAKKESPSILPSYWQMMNYTRQNLMSNMTSLYYQVELVGYKHYMHVPFVSPIGLCTKYGVPMDAERSLWVYSINKDEWGIIISMYNDMPRDYFERNEFISKFEVST